MLYAIFYKPGNNTGNMERMKEIDMELYILVATGVTPTNELTTKLTNFLTTFDKRFCN